MKKTIQASLAQAGSTLQISRKTFTVPLWVLVFLQTFTVWQMGVIYYSSKVFTINGVTPLPVSVDTVALPIALGYIAGALLSFFAPNRVGLWGKVTTTLSLGCIALLYAPFSPTVLAFLYYIEVFLCVTFIGILGTIVINLYSLKTALKDGIVATIVAPPLIALLHFQAFTLDFRIFNLISSIIQILILIGLSRIPNKTDTAFLSPQRKLPAEQRIHPPNLLLFGAVFIYTVVCLCCLFSSTAAESLSNGISLFYIAGTVWAMLFAVLHYKFKFNPFRLYTVFLSISAFGFIFWLFPLTSFRPISIALQAAVFVLSNLAWFTMGVLFEKWHCRLVAPAAILIALMTAMMHSVLLEILRNNTEILYALYAVVTLTLLIVYYATEPYFRRIWLNSYADTLSAGDNNGDNAADPGHLDAVAEDSEIDMLLTKRERELVPLIVQGYSNADVAKMLYISEHTVKTHMKNIYQKLEVHSRFELAAKINRMDER